MKATTTFTHIMQTKKPGTGTSPVTVMSLRRIGGVVEIGVGDGSACRVRWVVRDGGSTVIDATAPAWTRGWATGCGQSGASTGRSATRPARCGGATCCSGT